ncbi:hypothetical protein K3495_g7400 [Podosphaera aphanis]|nr:hypothetical protein K3495_g7400 [Podosphaera aphanis]
MQFYQIILGWLFFLLVSTNATPISEMREFVAIADSMRRSGVRIGIPLPSRNPENKSDLLLYIDPSNLMLVPDDLGFSKDDPVSTTDPDQLVSIANKPSDIQLLCQNEKVSQKFPEWGLIELCDDHSTKTFHDYLSKLFKDKGRIAMSLSDAKEAPIVTVGMLQCQRLHGPCLTLKPDVIELASIKAASTTGMHFISSSNSSGEPTAPLTIISVSATSSTNTITKAPRPTSNTLDSPPLYKDNITAYESYLSMLREKKATLTVSSTSTSTKVLWVQPMATRSQTAHKHSLNTGGNKMDYEADDMYTCMFYFSYD